MTARAPSSRFPSRASSGAGWGGVACPTRSGCTRATDRGDTVVRGLERLLRGTPRGLRRAVRIAVISLLGVVLPAGALVAAGQTAKPGFTVQVSPASQSVVRGSAAAYSITVTSQNSFA